MYGKSPGEPCRRKAGFRRGTGKRGEKSMELRGKMLPCGSREAVVTVLSYRNGVMDGYLQHPRLEEKEKIESLSQLILLLNSLVDLEDCPHTFHEAPGGCLAVDPARGGWTRGSPWSLGLTEARDNRFSVPGIPDSDGHSRRAENKMRSPGAA